jgi:hypothetical protein
MGGPNISWLPGFLAEFPAAEEYKAAITEIWNAYHEGELGHMRLLEENERLLAELRKHKDAAEQLENQWKYYAEVQATHYDKATAYANLILSAGYAGLFATWSMTASSMTGLQSALVGGLALLSLLFFVGWEITKATWAAVESLRHARLLEHKGPEFAARMEALQQRADREERFFQKAWVFALVGSLVPGAASGLLLMWLLGARLIAAI